MRGEGVKKLKWGQIEVGGNFINGQVSGKGYKKWRRTFNRAIIVNNIQRVVKAHEYFIYRGNLEKSQINGYGEFKWPDGRHYIGNFVNSQMHGEGKMTWHANNNEAMKIVFKGDFYSNVIQGTGTLKKSNGDIYKGFFENA